METITFDQHDREWECAFVRDGDDLDEASHQCKTGVRQPVKVYEIIKKQRELWESITLKTKSFVIFSNAQLSEAT